MQLHAPFGAVLQDLHRKRQIAREARPGDRSADLEARSEAVERLALFEDEAQAQAVCDEGARGEVLVPANFNAPGQIVLSGAASACERAITVAEGMGLRAKGLSVAGAFHSPLMEPAAEGLAAALEEVELSTPSAPVWSNVTGLPHDGNDPESIKSRLVQQLTSPVRWSQCCASMASTLSEDGQDAGGWHELAPGSVLRGLFRRIDRSVKVRTHDTPEQRHAEATNPSAD